MSGGAFVTWEDSDPDVYVPAGLRVDYSRTELTEVGYRAPLVRVRVEMRPPRKGERGWWVKARTYAPALAEVLRESEELGWIAVHDYVRDVDAWGMRPITVIVRDVATRTKPARRAADKRARAGF